MKAVRHDFPLARRTSFGIGGPADLLLVPRTAGDAARILDSIARRGRRPRILGGGTNLLVDDDGCRAPVVSTEGLRSLRLLPGDRIRAEAGVPLSKLIARATAEGLTGLEELAGIPGSVGGAVFMNAGGRGKAIGDRIESIETVAAGTGPQRIPRSRLAFGYRRSGLSGRLVLAAVFRLERSTESAVRRRTAETLEMKRETQPTGIRSAGCFFRNAGKVPAGLLIDKAGLKGTRIGSAMVSPVHANFIVNLGSATSEDVLRLARHVRDAVFACYGVRLRMEVKYWKSAPARVAPSPTILEAGVSPGGFDTLEGGGDAWR